ncbi:MAG TPA: beta-propeller fold lactonase family protein [Methylomirabilota bacterium]|nr:beta-propeller fold lactonase family protein [Methylomirabilota bacterium]
MKLALLAALAMLLGSLAPAHAEIAVSANDNKVVNINGKVTVVSNPPSDTVSIIDLKASPPRVIGEVNAPVSVVGPPLSVAVTPDESLALVTASSKVDPTDPTKQAPDNRVSVIDLKASPPRVLTILEAGKGAGGISINRQGTLALVSNMVDGTVSIFTIQGKTVTPAGTVEVGGAKAGGGMVAITPDGKTALVSRRDDHKVSVLAIEGSKVEYTKRDMTPGVRPIVMDIASNGAFAVVGSLAGASSGDHDSISLIDLTAKPPRVVDTIGVMGATAEGLKIAPDSSVVAVVVHNGSNRPKESPFYNDAGKLVMVRVTGKTLARVAEAPIGRWSQGAAFSADSKTILVGNMIEKDYWVLQWDGKALRDTGQRVKMNGGPAGIRTVEK